jgi:hypothetical protein
LNNIQEHFVYNISCENNNKVYIGQSIDPYKPFKQHMRRPPKKMKHDIDMSKTINLHLSWLFCIQLCPSTRLIKWKTIPFNILIVPLRQAIITLKENLHHTKSTGI